MTKITNRKIKNLTPEWTEFKGISLLLDNPNPSANLSIMNNDFWKINNQEEDFYNSISTTLKQVIGNQQLSKYLFCPLPAQSYHVTLLDGVNQGNLEQYSNNSNRFVEVVKKLPESMNGEILGVALEKLAKQKKPINEIEFIYDKLTKWGNKVLVVRLKPKKDSEEAYKDLIIERQKLIEEYFPTSSIDYSPHITMGYFANKEGGELASPKIEYWNNIFAQSLKNKKITFKSYSLYGFTDMATYFKLK